MVELHLICQCCRDDLNIPAEYRYELNDKILTREDKAKAFEPIYFCHKHLKAFQKFAGNIFEIK